MVMRFHWSELGTISRSASPTSTCGFACRGGPWSRFWTPHTRLDMGLATVAATTRFGRCVWPDLPRQPAHIPLLLLAAPKVRYSETWKQCLKPVEDSMTTARATEPRNTYAPIATFVSWRVVSCAFDPTALPTQAKIQTLRRNRVITKGVTSPLRTQTGLKGTTSRYSSLNVWLAAAFRRGGRARLNGVFAKSRNSLLHAADLLEVDSSGDAIGSADILSDVEGDIAELRRQLHISTCPARWRFTEGRFAVIEDDMGAEHRIPIDSPLLADSSLGDPVVVVDEETEIGVALRYVLPGLEPAPVTGSPELSAKAIEYLSPLLNVHDDSANSAFYESLLASDR